MLMLRRSGGTTELGDERTLPSTRTSPPSGSSNPAIMRKVVVLPQPDGPSRHTNSPWLTVKSIASTETTPAYRFVSLSRSRRAIASIVVETSETSWQSVGRWECAEGPAHPGGARFIAAERSALDNVDGDPAERGLLVLRHHVATGFVHRLDNGVERDAMRAVSAQRKR